MVNAKVTPMGRASVGLIRAAVAVAFACTRLANAHEGHEHKVMGVVAAVDASHVEVAVAGGKTESIQLVPTTRFKKANQPATAADLLPNGRIVVKYREANGQKTATEVSVAATPN